ncbi:MAG: chemotaxis protein CheC [Candidatus Omnitrophica bacterium]|jgi:chemotaxis protein CheC|nr:chemotaxis protein CheC [Candidatus Omnitrophota bacterium]MDD5079280.1 chemotaxis protein CheC [Candidatus Omnitrophota bacterium]
MADMNFTDIQKDALQEIGNICAGNAATALSQLLDRPINIVVPRILFLPIEDVPKAVGGSEKLVVGLMLRVFGDLPSNIVFIFSQRDAMILASLVTGKPVSESTVISEMERSALKEIGVILANAYLGALGSFVGLGLVPTVPELIMDMAGAILDYLLIELSCKSEFALLVESELHEPVASVTGHFFLIPDPAGMELITRAIGK